MASYFDRVSGDLDQIETIFWGGFRRIFTKIFRKINLAAIRLVTNVGLRHKYIGKKGLECHSAKGYFP